jgi:hypothetical protein
MTGHSTVQRTQVKSEQCTGLHACDTTYKKKYTRQTCQNLVHFKGGHSTVHKTQNLGKGK